MTTLGFSRMEERHAALIKVAYEDTPVLLAAVEAVLELTGRWDAEARSLDTAADRVYMDYPDAPGIGLKRSRAAAYEECAKAVREAVTAALTGKEAPGGLQASP
jgi:hypothetical protein